MDVEGFLEATVTGVWMGASAGIGSYLSTKFLMSRIEKSFKEYLEKLKKEPNLSEIEKNVLRRQKNE